MTAKEVAEKFRLGQSTVTKRARKLGFDRIGRDWHFTEAQALAIAAFDATPGPKSEREREQAEA